MVCNVRLLKEFAWIRGRVLITPLAVARVPQRGRGHDIRAQVRVT